MLSLREMVRNQTSRGRRRLESMDFLRRSQTCGVTSSSQLQSNVSLVVLPVAELNDSVSNLFDDRSRSEWREGEHRCAEQTIHFAAVAADLVCACMTRRL